MDNENNTRMTSSNIRLFLIGFLGPAIQFVILILLPPLIGIYSSNRDYLMIMSILYQISIVCCPIYLGVLSGYFGVRLFREKNKILPTLLYAVWLLLLVIAFYVLAISSKRLNYGIIAVYYLAVTFVCLPVAPIAAVIAKLSRRKNKSRGSTLLKIVSTVAAVIIMLLGTRNIVNAFINLRVLLPYIRLSPFFSAAYYITFGVFCILKLYSKNKILLRTFSVLPVCAYAAYVAYYFVLLSRYNAYYTVNLDNLYMLVDLIMLTLVCVNTFRPFIGKKTGVILSGVLCVIGITQELSLVNIAYFRFPIGILYDLCFFPAMYIALTDLSKTSVPSVIPELWGQTESAEQPEESAPTEQSDEPEQDEQSDMIKPWMMPGLPKEKENRNGEAQLVEKPITIIKLD